MKVDPHFAARFLEDISRHELTFLKEDGLHRHMRFQRPGSWCMHFDIITWPGYLCYTGDMGTFVFKRLDDMLQFFRRGKDRPAFSIDYRYWAEKVESADKCDGIGAFDLDEFKANVRDYFEQNVDEDWPAERKAALWAEIESDVLYYSDDGEPWAWVRLHEFAHDGFRFVDFGRDCKAYSHSFLWCCHALEWAIATYDAAKAAKTEKAAA